MTLPEPPALGTAMLPPGTFANDVVMVTGGGTGLGRAIATEFGRLGAAVAIVSRSPNHQQAGVRDVEAAGGRAMAFTADIRDPTAVSSAFDAAESVLGPVSVLVNNAAANFEVTAEQMSPNAWRAVTDIVLNGTFFCSTDFARRRVRDGAPGSVLNISATYAWTGAPGAAHSGAAKAAVNNLTQSLAVEWAPDGIRVNGLAPGMFPHNDMDDHWGEGREIRAQQRAAQVPAGRVGRLQEIGWAATYLCSPFASYLTGHIMVLDGGNWLRRHGFSTPTFVPIRELVGPKTEP